MIDQHASLGEKFLKKGFWLYFFGLILAPVWYMIKIIISWELSVSEVGILYGIISLITMLSAYNDLWMTESLHYFLPKYITDKQYDKVKSILTYALIAQISTWLTIASFFFFWADFVANNYFKAAEAADVLKVFALYFLGINMFQIILVFFLSIQNTFYNRIVAFFRLFFTLLSIVLILFLDIGTMIIYSYAWIIWLFLWVAIAIYLFVKKYYIPYLKTEKILWSKSLYKEIFAYASMVFLWTQASVILSQIDMQMIIIMLGTTDAWYYTNYLNIIGIPFMVIGPIFWLLFPIFAEMHAKWQHNHIKLVKTIFQRNFLIIAIAFNILLFVFAEIIAVVLFWEKFLQSGTILYYSIWFLIFNFLLKTNFQIIAGIWKVSERAKIITTAIFINIVLNYFLIQSMWVYGAALATGIGWVFIWIMSEFVLGKKYYVPFDWFSLGKNVSVVWIMWLLSFFYLVPFFEWFDRIMSFGMIFWIWCIWFFIVGIINISEFKYFISEVRKLRK